MPEPRKDEYGMTAQDWRMLIVDFNAHRISAPKWMADAARKSQIEESRWQSRIQKREE